jgi:hypothetical protein
MWNMKCFVVPVVVQDKDILIIMLKYLEAMPRNHLTDSTKHNCTNNITNKTESIIFVKPEWCSPSVQEKCLKVFCDKRI